MNIINYRPGMRIVNLEQLPKGTGCPYLEVMSGEGRDLVAVQWRKVIPKRAKDDHLFLRMVPAPSNGRALPGGKKDAITALDAQLGDKLPAAMHEDCTKVEAPKIKPTREQEAILTTVKQGHPVLMVEAGAGSGKTTQLVMIGAEVKGYWQYTAFNNALVNESAEKFEGSRVRCNTTHSLAFRAIGKRYEHRLGKNRVKVDQVARMLKLRDLSYQGDDGKTKTISSHILASQVIGAIKKFCQSADQEVTREHFKYIVGIDIPMDGKRTSKNNRMIQDRLIPFARRAWADLSDPDGHLPFTHDYYVKIWQLGKPIISADGIMLDEAQDTAPVMLDILRRQSCPLILVGDSAQQIYDWRGAVNAMSAFPGAPRLFLSKSFRFGQAIADVANSILATLDEKTPLRIVGFEEIDSKVTEIPEPTAILCRTNATAVSKVLEAISKGKKPFLVGGGGDVIMFVEGAKELQEGHPTGHPELACFDNWKEVQEYSKLEDGEDLRLMVKIIDKFGVTTILDALRKLPEEKDADLVISTAHRSKGRQWKKVKVAGDFPTASMSDDSDRRLLYVTVTRAQEELDISECPFFTGKDSIEITKAKIQELDATPDPIIIPPPAPVTPSLGFTWRKSIKDEEWLVHGPSGYVGTMVTVKRKNGPDARRRLVSIEKEFSDATLYRVQQ